MVEVDDDDRKETDDLVQERPSDGCHLPDDLIFKRGQFSIESGSWDDDCPMNCRDIG